MRFAGWRGFNRALWEDITGGGEGVLQTCGAKDIRVHMVRGGGDGDAHLDLDLRWS
jgi:hypothetical protein